MFPIWRIHSYVLASDGEQKFLKIVAQYVGDSVGAPEIDGQSAVKIEVEGTARLRISA